MTAHMKPVYLQAHERTFVMKAGQRGGVIARSLPTALTTRGISKLPASFGAEHADKQAGASTTCHPHALLHHNTPGSRNNERADT